MEVLIACLSVAGAIILVVVVLTLFFKLLDRLGRGDPGPIRRLDARGVLDPRLRVTIHMVDRAVMSDVRVLGTLLDVVDQGAPVQLREMLVVEHQDGRRSLIRARNVKSIEVPAPAGRAPDAPGVGRD
ncbi:hypothetical protein [Paludisphaera sp.]|uniref:hypothetical protein n=1 Tax=Paludisphaera sp. TaxID=2017432 RepID=UPI00301C9F77